MQTFVGQTTHHNAFIEQNAFIERAWYLRSAWESA